MVSIDLRITNVKFFKCFVKIFGIEKKNEGFLRNLQQKLMILWYEFKNNEEDDDDDITKVPNINQMYLVKVNNEYHRCKILMNDETIRIAHLFLIDYSKETQVSFQQLRPIFCSDVIRLPPLCDEFLLANCLVTDVILDDLRDLFLTELFDLLTHSEINIEVIHNTAEDIKAVEITVDSNNIIAHNPLKAAIEKHAVEIIELNQQISMMMDFAEKKNQMQQQQQQIRPIVRNLKAPAPPKFSRDLQYNIPELSQAIYKTNVLVDQQIETVRIVHYEKGPNLFNIQVQSNDSELQKLMQNLQIVELTTLTLAYPKFIGMACVAKYQKKNYRVAVAKLPDESHENILCRFVDFGFLASVRVDHLYYIPEEFIEPLTFAMPFCISGLKKTQFIANDVELSFYFRQITENRLLSLKCVPFDGPPNCQYCELSDSDGNILEKLHKFNPSDLKFASPRKLEVNKHYKVKVCYVQSAQDFYVQLEDKDSTVEFDMMYYDLQRSLKHSPSAGASNRLRVNQPVGVLIEDEWYRAIVLKDMRAFVSVLIIDFGNVEDISVKCVRLLANKFIEKPSFAHRCCLKGFEDMSVSENITTQFEIFCNDALLDRKVFKMKVIDNSKNALTVELEDESIQPPANVNRILLKNSRPLAETITLENARKRQQDYRPKVREESTSTAAPREIKSPDRGNGSSRGRGNHSTRGASRSSSQNSNNTSADQSGKRQRTHFKSHDDNTYSKSENKGQNSPSKKKENSAKQQQQAMIDDNENSPSKKNQQKSKSPNKKSSNKSLNDEEKSKSPSKQENSNSVVEKKENIASEQEKEIASNVVNKDDNMKSGWISTLLSINEAYIHFEEHVDNLRIILDDLYTYYDNEKRPKLRSIEIGATCAFKSVDTNWYRGEIKSVGKQCKVLNLEYAKAYFNIAPNECSEEMLLNAILSYSEEGSKELMFKIVDNFRDGFLIDPIEPQTRLNIFDEFVERKKIARRIDQSTLMKILDKKIADEKEECKTPVEDALSEVSQSESEANLEEKPVESAMNLSAPMKAKLTALTSPNEFYLMPKSIEQSFDALHNDIQILAPAMQPLIDFECGTLCLTLDPYDNQWYRARIIDSDEIITVQCCDNGKTFAIEKKIDLRKMPEQLENKNFYGIVCSLPVKINRKFEEDASALLLKRVEEFVEYEMITSTSKLNYVDLFFDGQNVVDLLIKKNFGQRIEIFSSGNCYTSHINSLNDFFIQLETDQLKLDTISSIMNSAQGKFNKVNNPKTGQIVAAKFPEDDGWYRSKIHSIESDGFMVEFIDYGNLCLVKEIGEIDARLTEIPAMAKHCFLSMPKDVIGFSPEAENKFMEITENGATILKLRVIKFSGDVTEVELLCANGQNISELLAPLCNKLKSDILKE